MVNSKNDRKLTKLNIVTRRSKPIPCKRDLNLQGCKFFLNFLKFFLVLNRFEIKIDHYIR